MDYGSLPGTAEDAIRDGCPRCGNPVVDMRNCGFSPEAFAVRRQCIIVSWGPGAYLHCVTRHAGGLARQEPDGD